MCFHGENAQESFQPLSSGRYQRIERGLANQLVENEVPLYKQESFLPPSFSPSHSSGRKRKSTLVIIHGRLVLFPPFHKLGQQSTILIGHQLSLDLRAFISIALFLQQYRPRSSSSLIENPYGFCRLESPFSVLAWRLGMITCFASGQQLQQQKKKPLRERRPKLREERFFHRRKNRYEQTLELALNGTPPYPPTIIKEEG